ncbi:hypothetical protein MYX78_00230 [Acidobacteria bacterium AH-259-G07]|nr:hypothetical protein [Acidobacteria bacterium AH-259-G07]
MKNVFIAIGGSGAKVAETFLRLLAIGFPTRRENTVLTSSGNSLQVWRVDTDLNSGAAASLQSCMRDYTELQRHLGDDAGSRWAMEVDPKIRHLNPLQLSPADANDNIIKTLRGILDSRYGDKKSSAPLLDPFYENNELDVVIDRGFYQKPFIGAAITAVFADSLTDETSPAGRVARLTSFYDNETNFFVCGSLHGGTGASGLPVMGRFLSTRRKPGRRWRIGACLLAPYFIPPQPPFKALEATAQITDEKIEELVDQHASDPAFKDLLPERKRELVRQILQGFYADPNEMEARARQSLLYYKEYSSEYFDEVYLVGKPEPDKLTIWSNGGPSQNNPLNSAEVVAALAALRFFSRSSKEKPGRYLLGASTGDLDSQKMNLYQLPRYSIGSGEDIDPEKVFLATAVLHHLLLHQIRWEVPAKSWSGIEGLRDVYKNNETKKESDYKDYQEALRIIANFAKSLVSPHETIARGWSGADSSQFHEFFSGDEGRIKQITSKVARKNPWSIGAKGSLVLGRSEITVSTVAFGRWSPPGPQFDRGEYLRSIWSELYSRACDVKGGETSKGSAKVFLNRGIVGGGAGVSADRIFFTLAKDDVDVPEYDPKFFETFPTAWASAYAFVKTLEANKTSEDRTVKIATEEWASLLLLHYYGIAHLQEYGREELQRNYDKDLWPALSGTYPAKGTDLDRVSVLETDDATVLGGYYEEVVFFPIRNRSKWSQTKETVLGRYLGEGWRRLSWKLCSEELLKEDDRKKEFHKHLRQVIEILPSSKLKHRLERFCDSKFGKWLGVLVGSLTRYPREWEIPADQPKSPSTLLDAYPFKKGDEKVGYTYYLVSGMPQPQPWATKVIVKEGCSPYQYRRTGKSEITVYLAGQKIKCSLRDNDKIVELKELFLSDDPYWSKIDHPSETHSFRIKPFHIVDLRAPELKSDEMAVCLAPLKREFLEHFPELFSNLDRVGVFADGDAVVWSMPIVFEEEEKTLLWRTTPILHKALSKTSVAIWPPKVSDEWRLYIAYVTGGKKKEWGSWHLIDENGVKGTSIELEEDEHVSVLKNVNSPNRPRALLFEDHKSTERGLLLLAGSDKDKDIRAPSLDTKVVLSVDFGTSNTCFAYKKTDSSVLTFGVSPAMVWGPSFPEGPGFVPFEWGGRKGFFPTVLLSRRNARKLFEIDPSEIRIEQLTRVDIPGLHFGLEKALYHGELNALWEGHTDLKWGLDLQTPWRSLFLALSLLYAHAEVFFGDDKGGKIDQYVFTFPLAMSTNKEHFHNEVRRLIRKVREWCYGSSSTDLDYIDYISESIAVARHARVGKSRSSIDLFIDVGGGTADIAVRRKHDFLALDSIRVAGNTFFKFAQKNFAEDEDIVGASQFKRHLARVLLPGKAGELEAKDLPMDLSTFYSLAINALTDEEFRRWEATVLKEGMGERKKDPSYQQYRTRLLFRHLLAYSLLQACAATIHHRCELRDGIKVILAGNGWGLMLFGELTRRSEEIKEESNRILGLWKPKMLELIDEAEGEYLDQLFVRDVELLNEKNFAQAKTAVSLGALNAVEEGQKSETLVRPYTGITIKNLRINDDLGPTTLRWCDKWGYEVLKERFDSLEDIESVEFEVPPQLRKPLDSIMTIFTCLGNARRIDQDNSPPELWHDVNAELASYITGLSGREMGPCPVNYFLSGVLYAEDEQRDFLDILAETNGRYSA